MKICLILGTRPEIIKMSPIIRECSKRRLNFFILHTNQHYSLNLDKIFFNELGLPPLKYNLRVGSGTHAQETGKMLIGIERVLLKEKPNTVLVEGDTNTVLAGALAAVKLHIPVGHVEAGLRSYSREMPEEVNRILADHCSDLLFAPTRKAKEILLGEGIPKQNIFLTGNTIVDAIRQQHLRMAAKRTVVLGKFKLENGKYFLATVHRAENVDNRERIRSILEGLRSVGESFRYPIVYPVHPRSKKMMRLFRLRMPKQIMLVDPVGYCDFLHLLKNSQLVFTDSGGIQEEACVLKVPCVTLRDNTERPETIESGANMLAGTDPKKIFQATSWMLKKKRDWGNPFGDGKSAPRIVDIVIRKVQ